MNNFSPEEYQKEIAKIKQSKLITHICKIDKQGRIQLPSTFFKSLGELKDSYVEIIENKETKDFKLMIHCDRFDITKQTVIIKQKVPKVIDFSEIDPRYREDDV